MSQALVGAVGARRAALDPKRCEALRSAAKAFRVNCSQIRSTVIFSPTELRRKNAREDREVRPSLVTFGALAAPRSHALARRPCAPRRQRNDAADCAAEPRGWERSTSRPTCTPTTGRGSAGPAGCWEAGLRPTYQRTATTALLWQSATSRRPRLWLAAASLSVYRRCTSPKRPPRGTARQGPRPRRAARTRRRASAATQRWAAIKINATMPLASVTPLFSFALDCERQERGWAGHTAVNVNGAALEAALGLEPADPSPTRAPGSRYVDCHSRSVAPSDLTTQR